MSMPTTEQEPYTPPVDLTTLNESDLDRLRLAVLSEQDRRYRQAMVPNQVQQMTKQFVEDGGDVALIEQAVSNATAPEPATTPPPMPTPEGEGTPPEPDPNAE